MNLLKTPFVKCDLAGGSGQCDQKKSPNLYTSWPKMISLEKLKILTLLQKLPKNVGDLGKLIALKSCPKSNKSPNLVTLVLDNKKFYFSILTY